MRCVCVWVSTLMHLLMSLPRVEKYRGSPSNTLCALFRPCPSMSTTSSFTTTASPFWSRIRGMVSDTWMRSVSMASSMVDISCFSVASRVRMVWCGGEEAGGSMIGGGGGGRLEK